MTFQRYAGLLFSPTIFRDILRKKSSRLLADLLQIGPIWERFKASRNLADFYSCIHNECTKSSPTEYFTKSAIIESLAYGEVKLSADSMIGEFRAGSSIADMVLLNGTSICLEIKTKYDGTEKLKKQVEDYRKIFDQTYAVIDKCHYKWAVEEVPNLIGLILLHDDGSLELNRVSKSNKKKILQATILASLRKNEYLEVLNHFFGFKNDCPNTQLYSIAEKYFCKIPKQQLHDYMVEVLKKRTSISPRSLLEEKEIRYLAPHIVDGKFDCFTARKIHDVLLSINEGNLECTFRS